MLFPTENISEWLAAKLQEGLDLSELIFQLMCSGNVAPRDAVSGHGGGLGGFRGLF